MNNLVFLRIMSPASMTRGSLTLLQHTPSSTPINPCPKRKRIRKSDEKGGEMKSQAPSKPLYLTTRKKSKAQHLDRQKLIFPSVSPPTQREKKRGSNRLDQKLLKSQKIQPDNQKTHNFQQKKQRLHNIDLQIAYLSDTKIAFLKSANFFKTPFYQFKPFSSYTHPYNPSKFSKNSTYLTKERSKTSSLLS